MQVKNVKNPDNRILYDRRSVRAYDTSVKISKEEMSNILQDAMTAPSSLNLQPWRFVVIESDETKELIKPYLMFNQMQLETSSAIVAVFGDMQNISYTDKILDASVKKGLMGADESQKRLEKIQMYTGTYTKEKIKDTILFDCGLVSMQIMIAAKGYGYDTNPIGGFMKKELTQVLGMDEKRYVPVILLSIGKSLEEPHDTIRFSVEEVTQWK